MNTCPNARIFDALRDLRKARERPCNLPIRIGGRNAYPVSTEKIAQHRLHHACKQRMTRGILRVCRERRDQALPCDICGRCIAAIALGIADGRLRTPKLDLIFLTPPDYERVRCCHVHQREHPRLLDAAPLFHFRHCAQHSIVGDRARGLPQQCDSGLLRRALRAVLRSQSFDFVELLSVAHARQRWRTWEAEVLDALEGEGGNRSPVRTDWASVGGQLKLAWAPL